VNRSPRHIDSSSSVATSTPAPAPEAERNVTAQSLPQTPLNPRLSRASRAARTQPLSPEVLVPGGQLAAALQLGDAVNGGSVDGERLVAVQNDLAKQLEWKPLEIAPLESSNVDPAGNGSTRF
jgi:hypothetical protein